MAKNKIQTLEGQSIFDVAVQTAGSVEAAIELATVNGLSITDDLQSAELRTTNVHNKSITGYYASRGIKPATGISDKGQIFEDIFNEVFA